MKEKYVHRQKHDLLISFFHNYADPAYFLVSRNINKLSPDNYLVAPGIKLMSLELFQMSPEWFDIPFYTYLIIPHHFIKDRRLADKQ
jgi:hypothetical protein